MSIHNAPIFPIPKSDSRHSLYTQNSQVSQSDILPSPKLSILQQQNSHAYVHIRQTNNQPKVQKQQKSVNIEQTVSQKIGTLPNLNNLQVKQNKKYENSQNNRQNQQDILPSLPKTLGMVKKVDSKKQYLQQRQGQNDQFMKAQPYMDIGKGIRINQFSNNINNLNQFHNQFNTISVVPPPHSQQMYQQQYLNSQSVGNNEQFLRSLRSSQGGRWTRSQSLVQQQQQQQMMFNVNTNANGKMNSIQLMLRNYHKHQSKFVEQIHNYVKFYHHLEKYYQNNINFKKYKISINDTLQQIKSKMQSYLQSKIDLSNLPIDRPDADWTQQQLIQFYTNYQQILVNKMQLPLQEQNKNNERTLTILKKYKNCTYYGPIKQGKKHGFGYLHYFSGRFFQGLFANDQKIQGFQMDDTQIYLGEYRKNQRHGDGILKNNQYLIAGVFTDGEFKVDVEGKQPQKQRQNEDKNMNINAQNMPQNQNPEIIRNGFKIQFSSIIFYPSSSTILQKTQNSDIFIGSLLSQQKNGQGLQLFWNGDIYIGNYHQNTPENYGEYYWQSGAFYHGNFISGMRHGYGVWMMVNGDRYEGEYMNDKKNGKGKYLWKSGDRYQGEFQNDYRHGFGEMVWNDGARFKGQWVNGIQGNKSFKLRGEGEELRPKEYQPTVAVTTSQNNNNNNKKSIGKQTRTRVLKKQSLTVHSGINTINTNTLSQNKQKTRSNRYSVQHTSITESNNQNYIDRSQRVPLQKLKAMLNPSNSIN